jgi:hypothetical protein
MTRISDCRWRRSRRGGRVAPLPDGSRFSLVIDEVELFLNRVKLKLVWFPQDYFAAHERPTNYREIRSKLGISVD